MTKPRVAIIDYGLCNLGSIRRATELCGGIPDVTQHPEALSHANYMILPGVGSFPRAMANLKSNGMDAAIAEQAKAGIPLLGICLGMQILASEGTEDGQTPGLNIIPGATTQLVPRSESDRLPHIGWNEISVAKTDDPIFNSLPTGAHMYFVHSYHFTPADSAHVAAVTPYCGQFVSMVRRDNIVGTQFHPEKSQRAGFQLLRNFLSE